MSILLGVGLQVAGFMFRTVLPYVLCIGIGWYACNQWRAKHNPDVRPFAVVSETVLSVDSGNEFTIKAGLLGRQSRGGSLWGIDIPTEVSENATTSLRSLIDKGDKVEVHLKEGRRIGKEDISGIVLHNGMNCNLEQLRRGWARASVKDKEFIAAQAEAEKARRGIWKSKDPDKPHHPRIPWWKEGV